MVRIERRAPADELEFRKEIYRGTIFLLDRTPVTERLVAEVGGLVDAELGEDGPAREAQFRMPGGEFFQAIGRLRKQLYQEERFFTAIGEIIAGFGFRPAENALDPLRMRVIADGAHHIPQAAPIYYTHRDTWYSHPQCQISWWIPLHDVEEPETFVFYPDYLDRAVENDSGAFDYDTWIRDRRSLRIGWQDRNAGTEALYPGFRDSMEGARSFGFSCRAGDLLVFSGAQLHRTLANETGRTRFSMDFRTVHLGDYAAGIGAPNADNRSTGTALIDYRLPEGVSLPAPPASSVPVTTGK